MINWKDENIASNPVQKHIQMSFEIIESVEHMAHAIVNDLINSNFNQKKSCVLVFVPTRKGTEEAVSFIEKVLIDKNVEYSGKVDFYHAGLDATLREEKYEKYKNGDIVILVATKAFGMGMDIKNIHFIYHLGPSSTFEDFLQEVGRAGRDEKMRLEAGFSDENPIQAKCLMTAQDFKSIKDRQHKMQITWTQINQVRETVFSYVQEFGQLKVDKESPFQLPLDLLDSRKEYEEIYGKDTFFRIALYWLEKLQRISLGVYVPTHLPIRILENEGDFSGIKTQKDRDLIDKLIAALNSIKRERNSESDALMVDMGVLKTKAQIKSTTKLFKSIFKAQKAGLLILERKLTLEITKLRTPELQAWNKGKSPLIIDAVFDFSERLIKLTRLNDQISLEGDYLESILNEVQKEFFLPRKIFWSEIKNKKNEYYSAEELAESQQKDFLTKRSKFAFKTINFLSKISHKSIIEMDSNNKPVITQLIYNVYTNHKIPLAELKEFKTNLIALISYVAKKNINENIPIFNFVDLIIELGLEDKSEDYIQSLIFIAKGLGYLKGEGSLVPMGVEFFIHDVSEIEDKEESARDYLVKQEFTESLKMKELRLLALECLSKLEGRAQDDFIKKYFQCKNLSDLISILEEQIGENDPIFMAFREEALKKEKAKLNRSQLEVYETSIKENLQVIAGPGTGKTHTLTLRVARLIQEEKISPDNILILAYNRAVVVELKDRLSKLFRALGYSSLIKRLKVFTFHGFVKFCIAEKLEDLKFKHWTQTFLKEIEETPGLISQKIGNIKYVFVDEFQDITSERMRLLRKIADPRRTKVCVIGDPNQSIYGYDRAAFGEPIDPKPYYYLFNEIYKPRKLHLNTNYRSYPQILEAADNLLSLNGSKFPMPELQAYNVPKNIDKICEIIDYNSTPIAWEKKLIELIAHSKDDNIKQIAIMFRSNNEVFRAFDMIQNEQLDNVRLRIQSAKEGLVKTREFHFLLSKLVEKGHQVLDKNYISQIEEDKKELIRQRPNWDTYLLNIFHCLAIEFEKGADENDTYADLVDFIKDIASKDDGQFGKIYEQNIRKIIPDNQEIEIVFTTMHKVKGLEFDAVLIPYSFSNLPIKETKLSTLDIIEEERRLYYVAYTRAKKKLVVIKFNREHYMDKGNPYTFSDIQNQNSIGVAIDEGIDKLKMYWSASNFGGNSFNFIDRNVSIGDRLVLKPETHSGFIFWYAYINNNRVAQLSRKMVIKIGHLPEVNGFIVTAVYVSTYEETLWSDEKNNNGYALKWTNVAKNRGYVYLIDFSGYGN